MERVTDLLTAVGSGRPLFVMTATAHLCVCAKCTVECSRSVASYLRLGYKLFHVDRADTDRLKGTIAERFCDACNARLFHDL